jgi:cytidylate kinase
LKLLEKDVILAQVLDDILNRDERDTKRLIAPLVITKESKVFDTSKLSVEEAVSGIISAFASN